MARSVTFTVSDASVVLTGTTYTITEEKDFNFLIETLEKFKNATHDSATVEINLYTTNTVLTTQLALRFGDLD